MEKTLIFIDGEALNQFILKKKTKTFKMDYFKLMIQIMSKYGKWDLMRTYYYSALPDRDFGNTPEERQQSKKVWENKKKFLDGLEENGAFEIELWHLKVNRDASGEIIYLQNGNPSFSQKWVDVKLASDIVKYTFLGNYDTFIVITADNDIAYCFKTARDMWKKIVWVNVATDGYKRQQLLAQSDKNIILDEADLDACDKNNPDAGKILFI